VNEVIVGYGVATVSRTDKMICLFCRISSLLSVSFAKETYHFIDPTNQSHPICQLGFMSMNQLFKCICYANDLIVCYVNDSIV